MGSPGGLLGASWAFLGASWAPLGDARGGKIAFLKRVPRKTRSKVDLGRVWGGFGEGLGRVWEGFGKGLGRVWEGLGKVFEALGASWALLRRHFLELLLGMLSGRALGGSWAGFWFHFGRFGRGLGRILGVFWQCFEG